MNETTAWLLLGTEGCHLCAEAEAMLLAQGVRSQVTVVDIAEQEQWQATYATRIPVLLHSASGVTLDWPFNPAQIQAAWAKTKPR
ncbi:MAG: glutaredoxin family protein [Methylococcales bacterium]|nr:glutaredoxin family protein [Methylococcales bacterium]